MGTLICNMDFSADMHDKANLPFAALKTFFDLANRVTQDKVKDIKIVFWSDDHHDGLKGDPLCVLSFYRLDQRLQHFERWRQKSRALH